MLAVLINRIVNQLKACCKRKGFKVGCFDGFCHQCLVTTSAYMHTYCYPLFESGMQICLQTISLCRMDMVLLRKHKEQQ